MKPTADSTKPVRFLAVGDSDGGGPDQYSLMEQMNTVPFDLIIHTGDLAYDDGSIGQFEDNVFGVTPSCSATSRSVRPCRSTDEQPLLAHETRHRRERVGVGYAFGAGDHVPME